MNFHKIKTSQWGNELLSDFSYFILEMKEQSTLNYTRVRQKDFSIIQVIRILNCLLQGDQSFSGLFKVSGWGMKKSFINYIHFCIDFRLIKKEQIGHNMIYSITERGKIFWDLFKNASS